MADKTTAGNTGALDGLIKPIERFAFLEQHWEQKHLLARAGERQLRSLLSLEAIDGLLSAIPLRDPHFRMMRDGRSLPVPAVAEAGEFHADFGDRTRLERVFSCFRDGATLVLQNIQDWHPPLRGFCRELAWDLSANVHVNIYLSPSLGQGLPVHVDGHDVFVVQLHGSKRWRVYGEVFHLPRKGGAVDVPDSGALLDELLRPGDVLYLPRGHAHEARAADGISLHATIGITGITYSQVLVHALLSALQREAISARCLPPLFATDTSVQKSVIAELSALHERIALELDSAVCDATARLGAALPSNLSGHLLDLDMMRTLGLESRLVVRSGLIGALAVSGDRLVLEFNGKELSFPLAIKDALIRLLFGTPIAVQDIPGLGCDADRLELSRVLVREGLLSFVDR